MPLLKLQDTVIHLSCVLCKGYLVDATTIAECFHNFCKSCIVNYVLKNGCCPVCNKLVNKIDPLLSLREDKKLQDIVYKVVPGLYKSEMRRRKEFYNQYPNIGPSSLEDGGVVDNKCRIIISADDDVSISLEYYSDGRKNMMTGDKYVKQKRPGGESHDMPTSNENLISQRYLSCPGAVKICHLQKFIRKKFGLPSDYEIDIIHHDEVLTTALTLIDVAYIYTWNKKSPLNLSYLIRFANRVKSEKSMEVEEMKTKTDTVPAIVGCGKKSPKSNSKCENTTACRKRPTDDSLLMGPPTEPLPKRSRTSSRNKQLAADPSAKSLIPKSSDGKLANSFGNNKGSVVDSDGSRTTKSGGVELSKNKQPSSNQQVKTISTLIQQRDALTNKIKQANLHSLTSKLQSNTKAKEVVPAKIDVKQKFKVKMVANSDETLVIQTNCAAEVSSTSTTTATNLTKPKNDSKRNDVKDDSKSVDEDKRINETVSSTINDVATDNSLKTTEKDNDDDGHQSTLLKSVDPKNVPSVDDDDVMDTSRDSGKGSDLSTDSDGSFVTSQGESSPPALRISTSPPPPDEKDKSGPEKEEIQKSSHDGEGSARDKLTDGAKDDDNKEGKSSEIRKESPGIVTTTSSSKSKEDDPTRKDDVKTTTYAETSRDRHDDVGALDLTVTKSSKDYSKESRKRQNQKHKNSIYCVSLPNGDPNNMPRTSMDYVHSTASIPSPNKPLVVKITRRPVPISGPPMTMTTTTPYIPNTPMYYKNRSNLLEIPRVRLPPTCYGGHYSHRNGNASHNGNGHHHHHHTAEPKLKSSFK